MTINIVIIIIAFDSALSDVTQSIDIYWKPGDVMSTKDLTLSLLRREHLTVAELAARLDVKRNAIVVQLRQLESAGLVEGRERKDRRVGKPATEYCAVAGHEDDASLAYPAFAETLIRALPDYLSASQIQNLMLQVGRMMAQDLDAAGKTAFAERLKTATDFADSLGAETSIETTGEGAIVRSFSCPLGRVVRRQGCACSVISAFFSEVTGRPADEQCSRGEKLYCRFLISNAA